MAEHIIRILYKIIFGYFAFSALYLFFFSLAGLLFYRRTHTSPEKKTIPKTVAILVPAYKEDGIILSTIKNLLALDYPRDFCEIYLIADGFQETTLQELRKLPIQLLEVAFQKSTKTNALNEAFRTITSTYDIALICDADNMLAPDFLRKIDNVFQDGGRAVQGRRVAKNLDSSFAILDACSEAINNNIFRKGSNAIGLSSAVIGSGMAFEFGLLKKILNQIDAVGGFDKILQLEIVKLGIKIIYLDDALVFDEKVSSSHAFQQQRRRWVSSQFIYFWRFLMPAVQELFRGNMSYFNLAVVVNLILPRAFLFVMLPAFAFLSFLISSFLGLSALMVWLVFLASMVLALPAELINRKFYFAILKLPKAIGLMLGTVFQIRKANKTFIHTVHTKTEISNLLFTEKKKGNG